MKRTGRIITLNGGTLHLYELTDEDGRTFVEMTGVVPAEKKKG